MLGLLSLSAFLFSVAIILAVYFSYRKLPLVGVGIVKSASTDTAVSTVVTGVRGKGFKGFLKLLTTGAFWGALIKSLFKNTKDEVVSTFKRAFFSLVMAVGLFFTSLVTGLIQIIMWIF
jgi:hypothetical protein